MKISKRPVQVKESRKPSPFVIVGVLVCCVGLGITYWNRTEVITSDFVERITRNISCSDDYKTLPYFDSCSPKTFCGRIVSDNIVTLEEVGKLLDIAKRGFSHGGSYGGASILDLHSGALSKGDKFVNIYAYLDEDNLEKTFNPQDLKFYSTVRQKVHNAIKEQFGIDGKKLYLTHPTFFSRITNTSAKTQHDEYWHQHIDKIQYVSFDYTSLLYLSDYGTDFTGGRFVFDNPKSFIEPKKGRLSFFTSGSENPHRVEEVFSGTRYAITVSFTCDPSKAIKDPTLDEIRQP